MEMAKYILQILRTKPMVVLSWGFHNPRRLSDDRGLSFMVNGFKYQGCVEVVYNIGMDLFDVVLTKNGTKIEEVYIDNLIEVIDNLVEKTSDYRHRVHQEYAL